MSLYGDGFLHALDMVVNQRIYLSTYDAMKDPDEGWWSVVEHKNHAIRPDENHINIVAKKLRNIVDSVRYTSFTTGAICPLLWAHYAGGFSGIALEYDLDETVYDIRKIDYKGSANVTLSQIDEVISGKKLPQDIGILKQKMNCWEYEDEYRLYVNRPDEYISGVKPMSIILGIKPSKYSDVFVKISRTYKVKIGYLSKRQDEFVIRYFKNK